MNCGMEITSKKGSGSPNGVRNAPGKPATTEELTLPTAQLQGLDQFLSLSEY